MFCSKCGNKLEPSNKFCNKCGNQVQNQQLNNYQQPNYSQNQYSNYQNVPTYQMPSNYQEPKSGNNLAIIIVIISFLAIILITLLLIPDKNNPVSNQPNNPQNNQQNNQQSNYPNNQPDNLPAKDRTIMIYMTGSDLEDKGFASNDLNDIVPAKTDLENVNVILIAGGARSWKNSYITASETGIFELTETGFEKVKKYQPVRNMGDSNLLSEFLNYSYSNYRAKKYDLILWNHGAGIFGTNVDIISNDMLSITEFKEALARSPFNKNNKLEYVNLIACLEGNLEYAIVLSEYANYMVASEEVSLASPDFDKLDSLTQVATTDNAFAISKKFIEHYVEGLNEYENYYNSFNEYSLSASEREILKQQKKSFKSQTYSIIDLTKISDLKNAISDFFSSIDVNTNYKTIARIRANMVQYGQVAGSNDYDSVDIYELVNSLRSLSPTKADKVLNALKNAVKYNWSNNNYSNGLALYFPYYGKVSNITAAIGYRKIISTNDAYNDFITKFFALKSSYSNMNWAFEEDSSSLTSSIKVNSEFGFYLTKEEALDYVKANYQIFRKYNNNYIPIYSSSNIEFDKNKNYLKVNYTNRGLKVNNEIRNIYLKEVSNDGEFITYSIPVKLYDDNSESSLANLTYYFDIKNNYGYVGEVTLVSESDLTVGMIAVNLKDYKYIEFTNTAYNITKDNKYTEDWKMVKDVETTKLKTENLKIELVDLADKYDYVAVIQVYDAYGNGHYTPLIKIEN